MRAHSLYEEFDVARVLVSLARKHPEVFGKPSRTRHTTEFGNAAMSAKGAKIFKTKRVAACSSKSIPVVSLAWHN